MISNTSGSRFYGGFDLGAFHSVIASADDNNLLAAELECNDLSGRTTPSVVAYSKRHRLIGDPAEHVLMREPHSTFSLLPLLTCIKSRADFENPNLRLGNLKSRFGPQVSFLKSVQEDGKVNVEFGGKTWTLDAGHILAAYLRRLSLCITNGRNIKQAQQTTIESGHYCIALPDVLFPDESGVVDTVLRACAIGGLGCARVTSQLTAVISTWLVRNLSTVYQSQDPSYVGFLNVGYSETSMQFIKLRRMDENMEEPAENEVVFNDVCVTMMPRRTIPVGTAEFLKALGTRFVQILKTKGKDVERAWNGAYDGSKELTRAELKAVGAVMSATQKLLKDLSGLNLAYSTYSDEESDISVEFKREELEQICADYLAKIDDLIRTCVADVSEAPQALLGVELVGGGSRIPVVQRLVDAAINVTPSLIKRTLEGTAAAAAFGATYIASGLASMKDVFEAPLKTSDDDREIETALRKIEENEVCRMEASNNFEAALMRVENLAKRSDVVDPQELKQKLEQLSDWYYAAANETAEAYDKRREELEALTQKHCTAYLESERKKRNEAEADLERRAAANEGKSETRRFLSNAKHLERAEKHKEEGRTTLVDAKNPQKALESYVKALQHLNDMNNEKPDELAKKNTLKSQIHFTLAKIFEEVLGDQGLDKVIENCTEALACNPTYTKALYKRGCTLTRRKMYKDAVKDLTKCLEAQKDQGDTEAMMKATTLALSVAKRKMDEEKKREQQMWAKSFQ
eukprot:Blabericola_migrator_1__3053@NODE_188_length_11708_cov_118_709303_g163_i0_p3_GENE_NODE_188_length_11708_cov_118_709303_g163_i0NODE_188_length_11708_cov_118_709303_g163_i0_p3_ORF_typecomplete_len746_score171_02HSP70/PF00012_20/1_3e19TPR_1/PF00515_28/11TPR_1/PF00515_28/20TPR_1/PF00515_28/0_011TPR_9/PF13371_6/2_2e03TPR_9/PF13371_6/1_4e03TPR_9/PF13371_6/6_3e05TPR_2/PF07719_17/5_8TPR_2/PF07719_17/5_3e02TPR_2/PF07719_17/0_14TPR_8/PF13181_6/81TPR_8/PF13181_6/4_2e02TPR_8/PF13181_6/0_12MreB_Mbl/PF06723_1